jgi:hypothetical protein
VSQREWFFKEILKNKGRIAQFQLEFANVAVGQSTTEKWKNST